MAAVFAAASALGQAPPPTYPECRHKPTAADVEGAKGAHKAATQFYDRADYDRAIQYWRDAYSFDCTAHAVLINIANAYEKKGDKAAAIATLETFLTRDPHSPEAANVSQKLSNLKAAVQAENPAGSASAAPSTPPPEPTTAPAATATEAPPPPPPSAERPFGVTPLIVAAAGGVLVVAGAILVPVGAGKISDAEQQCPDRKHCANDAVTSEGNQGILFLNLGAGALIAGGIGVVGGLVWQFAFNKPKEQPKGPSDHISVRPLLGPHVAGAGVATSF